MKPPTEAANEEERKITIFFFGAQLELRRIPAAGGFACEEVPAKRGRSVAVEGEIASVGQISIITLWNGIFVRFAERRRLNRFSRSGCDYGEFHR